VPWLFLCAIGVLAIPSDAEVFAVSLYAFCWAGILLELSPNLGDAKSQAAAV
jgi:hypothetical protein